MPCGGSYPSPFHWGSHDGIRFKSFRITNFYMNPVLTCDSGPECFPEHQVDFISTHCICALNHMCLPAASPSHSKLHEKSAFKPPLCDELQLLFWDIRTSYHEQQVLTLEIIDSKQWQLLCLNSSVRCENSDLAASIFHPASYIIQRLQTKSVIFYFLHLLCFTCKIMNTLGTLAYVCFWRTKAVTNCWKSKS